MGGEFWGKFGCQERLPSLILWVSNSPFMTEVEQSDF